MKIKEFFRKLILKEKSSSDEYIKFLRKKGVTIGEDVSFYSPSNTLVDIQYPWLIKIGNHVRITHGVIILTHDYSWSVLKRYTDKGIDEGKILGASVHVVIGDNVFIGMNSIITRNVTIGDNVIIGAGSIVTKDCEANCVYAGSPAKRIMTVKEYYFKRENAQLEEAVNLARAYYEKYKKYPPEDIFHEYFMLWEDKDTVVRKENFVKKMQLCENFDKSIEYMEKEKRKFKNFSDFISYSINKNM